MRANAYINAFINRMTWRALYEVRRFGQISLEANSGHLFLWLPVCFGVGLIIYFALPNEPSAIPALLLTGLALVAMLRLERMGLRMVAIIIFMMAAGFSWAQLRT